MSTASQQIDVFSRILKTSVASILRFRGSSLENIITDLVKLVGRYYTILLPVVTVLISYVLSIVITLSINVGKTRTICFTSTLSRSFTLTYTGV